MGLGIRDLFYHFIFILHNFFPEFTEKFLHFIFTPSSRNSIGSWRDATGICLYIYKLNPYHPLINYLISTINTTLFHDLLLYNNNGHCDTNIAKWIPRENSQKKWLFQDLSIEWCEKHHPHLLKHCKNKKSRIRAERKCFSIYRKVVSKLSKSLYITEHCISQQNVVLDFNTIQSFK